MLRILEKGNVQHLNYSAIEISLRSLDIYPSIIYTTYPSGSQGRGRAGTCAGQTTIHTRIHNYVQFRLAS